MAKRHITWWDWLFKKSAKPKRLLMRRFEVADAVLEVIKGNDLSDEDRMAFAELVMKLDANPIRHSDRLAAKPPVPGMRWAAFADHKIVLVFDPTQDRIRILAIEL